VTTSATLTGGGAQDAVGAEPSRNLRRVPSVTPWAVFGAAVTAVVLGFVLLLQNRGVPGTGRFFDPVMPAVGVAYSAVGAFLLSRRPSNRVGQMYCAGFLLAASFLAEQYAVYALLTAPGSLPGGRWAAWAASWMRVPGHLLPWTLLPLLYPDGRPAAPSWAAVVRVAAGSVVVITALVALSPAGMDSPALENPISMIGTPRLATVLQALCILILGPISFAAVAVRYRRSQGSDRDQLGPFVAAVAAVVLVPVLAAVAAMSGLSVSLVAYQVVGLATLLGLPAATLVAVARHRLYGLTMPAGVMANRVVAYGTVLVVVLVLYSTLVGLLAVPVSGRPGLGPAIGGLAVVAVVGHRLRGQVQGVVDRLLYRQRQYDYRVLGALGERLRSTLGPDAVLPAVVETIAGALRVPHVAVTIGAEDDEPTLMAAYGDATPGSFVVPLVHQGELVGRLEVSPRSSDAPFDAADRRLLEDLAGQVAVVAYALRLAADLQHSREQLVNAQAEERRRLRRDLHDGLQPALAGVTLGLEAVRTIIGPNSPTEELLGRLKAELEGVLVDVRRLVYDLRPPALDDLGLVGALRQQAARFSLAPDTPEVLLDAPRSLNGLPAATEVAAYRIAQEALENVRKHARARSCVVVISHREGYLELEVRDDGVGLDAARRSGVGLAAMRERATELGGSCSVEAALGRGTVVRARLPMASMR
jgi:two-component system, NarL family, sensor kinase